jgi:pimeloyl-ACP methyl ester carboxylesterase
MGIGNSVLLILRILFLTIKASVHLWQGDEDKLIDVKLQRFIAKKLPWIQYHELSGAGHFFPYDVGISKVIIMTLLFGEK